MQAIVRKHPITVTCSLKASLHRRFVSRNLMQFSVAVRQTAISRQQNSAKSEVVYMRDIEVATQSETKIASSCATKIAFVNGPLQVNS